MTDESFLLVNLKEDKAKKLAQVLSNDSCRKILEFLTENKEATETEISEKLDIPISTVHYNLQHLYKAKLVEVDEYHYSKKGKEVNHYKLANKFIVIAPRDSPPGFMEKLKSILPLGIFAVVGAGAIEVYNWLTTTGETAIFATTKAMDTANEEMIMAASSEAPRAASQLADTTIQTASSEPNLALWFLAGSVFMILIMLIIHMIKRK